MPFRVFPCVMSLLLLAMPVYAQQVETRLSNALFYDQVSNYQPANIQPQNKVILVSRKDPFIAGALSFLVTGLGQAYNGEYTKGLLHFTVAVSGYTLYFLALEDNYYYDGWWWDPDHDDSVGIAGLLVGVGPAVWSVIDAPISANRINRRNQQRISIQPNPMGATLTYRW